MMRGRNGAEDIVKMRHLRPMKIKDQINIYKNQDLCKTSDSDIFNCETTFFVIYLDKMEFIFPPPEDLNVLNYT